MSALGLAFRLLLAIPTLVLLASGALLTFEIDDMAAQTLGFARMTFAAVVLHVIMNEIPGRPSGWGERKDDE